MARLICSNSHVFDDSTIDELACPRCGCLELSLLESATKSSSNQSVNIANSKFNAHVINIKQDNRDSSKNKYYQKLEPAHPEVLPRKIITKKAGLTLFTAIAFFLPLLNSLLDIFSYFGLTWNGPGAIPTILLSVVGLVILLRSESLWIKLHLKNDKLSHYRSGYLYEKNENGDATKYVPQADCIYPHCHGKITLANAPERPQSERSFVGICTVAGREHSYLIDHNLVATKKKFNWQKAPRSK